MLRDPLDQYIYVSRDPLDQYSDWPCNKCDFSLEVTSKTPRFAFLLFEESAEGGLKPKSAVEDFFTVHFVFAIHFNPPAYQGARLGEED